MPTVNPSNRPEFTPNAFNSDRVDSQATKTSRREVVESTDLSSADKKASLSPLEARQKRVLGKAILEAFKSN